jgi:glucokinase
VSLLGIDIGGTKLALALSDDAGRLHRSHRQPMPLSGDPSRDLETLAATLERFLASDGFVGDDPLRRIGASVPGPCDPERGVLINPPNLPGWHDVPIGPWLSDRFGAEARVENDANAAALAEAAFGAGRGVRDLVYLTMSTGVGSGVIAGGRLVRGAFGGGGEAGHMAIVPDGRRCACGLAGCLEAYVGGNAWRDHLREIARTEGRVAALAGGREAITPVHVVRAAKEGDAEALGFLDVWLDDLARGIASLVMLLEPRRVILGTIAVAAGEALCFSPLRDRLAVRLWSHQTERLEVVPAELGDALPERAGLAAALDTGPGVRA